MGGQQAKQHYLTLDGLRGVAAIVVLFFHRRWLLPDAPGVNLDRAFISVDFFFLLSGFVMALAYHKRIAQGMPAGKFATVRAIRLYPTILLAGLITILTILGNGRRQIFAALFTALALPTPPGLVPDPFQANGPVWSLFFELVTNVGYFVILRYAPRLLLPSFLIAAVGWVAMLVMLQVPGLAGSHYNTLLWGLPRAAFPFGIGVLLYRFLRPRPLSSHWFLPTWALLAYWLVAPFPAVVSDRAYAAISVLIAFPAIIALATCVQAKPWQGRLSAWLGAMSFPLYAIHYPLLGVGEKIAQRHNLSTFTYLATTIVAIGILSHLILKFYELPVRNKLTELTRGRFSSAPPPQHFDEVPDAAKGQTV